MLDATVPKLIHLSAGDRERDVRDLWTEYLAGRLTAVRRWAKPGLKVSPREVLAVHGVHPRKRPKAWSRDASSGAAVESRQSWDAIICRMPDLRSAPKTMRDLWILLRSGGGTRRFLKIMVGGDGSVYLALADARRDVAIAAGTITIPDGATSASVDYIDHITATFTDVSGEHVGYKNSGRIIEKYGDRHRRVPIDIGPNLQHEVLPETIYPAPLHILPAKQPRARDLVLPDDFDYRSREGSDMESMFGANTFRVEIWQMAANTTRAGAAPEVVGACAVKAGERQLVIAFVQDDTDRRRGWYPHTRTLRQL